METRTIAEASAYWIDAPLRKPYTLSFASLTSFEMLIVRVVDTKGRVGLGETCPIRPYSAESASDVWSRLGEVLPALVGLDAHRADEVLNAPDRHLSPFARVAPATACEALAEPPAPAGQIELPLVGTVLESDPARLSREVDELVSLGYRTLKVKVGFEPVHDRERVAAITSRLPQGVRVRLDANEAWRLDQAEEFLHGLDPTYIELLEQPFPRRRWDWVEALVSHGHEVPLMLDESIDDETTLRRARDAGVRIIKLKLMKAGSRRRLHRLRNYAQRLGMSVVIGNGIAGVIDNWYESLCALDGERAGEMNGNLKLADSLLTQSPVLDHGILRFTPGFTLDAEESTLAHKSTRVRTSS